MTDLIPEEREKERIIHCLLKINEFTFQFKMSNGEVWIDLDTTFLVSKIYENHMNFKQGVFVKHLCPPHIKT